MFYKKYLYFICIPFILIILLAVKKILSLLNTSMRNDNANPYKVVAFDLDETLGCFTEIGIFWDALENFYGHNLFPNKFHEVLDIFPEFFRPDIFKILDYIHTKRTCRKLFIYTNNQGDKNWLHMLTSYIDKKLGYKVFNQVVAAYKVNGKQIEAKRTSHEKILSDLIRCTDIPPTSEVCFIDDLYHPLMDKDTVSYLNIKPYHFSLPYDEMARRYYIKINMNKKTTKKITISEPEFVDKMVNFMKRYNYRVLQKGAIEEKSDKAECKKLWTHLEEFLKPKKINQTRKQRNKRTRTLRNK